MGGRLLAASLALALMLAGACSGAGAPASPQAATGSPSPAASRGPAEPRSTAAPPTAPTEAASTALERITRTLTVSATGEGTVTPDGTTTHEDGVEVTLRASWSDATHEFSWGGDCSGTASRCVLTMDAAKSVTATFTALPAGRCAQPSDADCIRAVYRGAPGDYAQVVDIPADVLLEPDANGRYRVARGQQLTVVTAAALPAGWTRFYLERSPLEFGTPSPVSASQLIAPVGTTYTFTPAADEAGSTLITFDLTAARPFVRPRPDGKPELGDVIVTTVFQVETDIFSYDSFDTTGAATAAGSYAFLMPDGTSTSVVTTYEQLRTESTVMRVNVDDAHGASWASFYNAVEVGDVVEWREADDCWARYLVTSTPTATTGATRDFGVRWVTYSYTGCSGEVDAGAVVQAGWAPEDIKSPDIRSPVYHGHFLVMPVSWADRIDTRVHTRFPPPAGFGATSESASTTSIAEARGYPLWREPALPEDWVFRSAETSTPDAPVYGFSAIYGYRAVEVAVGHLVWTPEYLTALSGTEWIRELRIIDGRPATLTYTPVENRRPGTGLPTEVLIYDQDTRIYYLVIGFDESLTGSNIDATIAIARSLLPQADPP